jgi:hypothetical protein
MEGVPWGLLPQSCNLGLVVCDPIFLFINTVNTGTGRFFQFTDVSMSVGSNNLAWSGEFLLLARLGHHGWHADP